jgi:integrase
MEMKDVSVAMGHSSVGITEQIYAHTLPARLRKSYDSAWEKSGETA